MGKTIIFAYGSLKRGGRGNRFLATQEYLGEAITEPHYRLFDLGSYPGLVHDKDNGLAVRGELWEVDEATLAELDDYEYLGVLYTREKIAIQGTSRYVESFIYNKPIPENARSGDFWPFPAATG